MEILLETLKILQNPMLILIIIGILLWFNWWVFNRMKVVNTGLRITRHSITAFLVLVGILSLVLTLPTEKENTKFEILKFLGILISAGIALSSTTLLGNLIAGIMNNSMKRFRNGDLIKIGDYQGRVTQKGIFHIEIQLEDSNFMTIPNLYIATNTLKLTRKSNTVISTSVSLGYDVPRLKIESALKDAAIATGLTDPYVYITSLGDFSVVYKIHGFLEDSGKFFSVSSLLNGKVMDALHENKIEIVSPTFMNQRRIDGNVFIPKLSVEPENKKGEPSPEELIFDEANKSESIEKKKDLLKEIEGKRKTVQEELKEKKGEKESEQAKSKLKRLDEIRDKIKKGIQQQSDK